MDSAKQQKFFARKLVTPMTLYKYFKREDCFSDPRGSLSLAITPQVIASITERRSSVGVIVKCKEPS